MTNTLFLFSVLITGLGGIVAQIILFRELLVNFSGNELTLGIMLAHWVIAEAIGVLSIGPLIDSVKNKGNIFIFLQIFFSLALIASLYLSRVFREMFGMPIAVGLSFYQIFLVSLFIIFPVGFCHGGLFSCGCKMYSVVSGNVEQGIGKVYTWETVGTIFGGILVTYCFIPLLNSFQVVFIIAVVSLGCTFFILKLRPHKLPVYTSGALILALCIVFLSGGLLNAEHISIKKQWGQNEVLDYQNSPYGNIVVTKRQEQYTFFYNGLPVIITPYPDITFVEEFGNFPLLFHPSPERILLIGGGAGGLINEMLKHPVKVVDYLELDPVIIRMVKKFPTALTQKELSDQRVFLKNEDGRFYMRNTHAQYDVILIGFSSPSDLSTNRFFTQEFFALANTKLKTGGILAVWLPGSLTYLSRELKELNASILNALKTNYRYVRIIPGEYNIFLSSNSFDIEKIDTALIQKRIEERGIHTGMLNAYYLDYRLSKEWVDWFLRFSAGATKQVNQDARPFAVFEMLVFWNKKFSPAFLGILDIAKKVSVKSASLFIFLLLLPLLLVTYTKKDKNIAVLYGILTTGFFGMLINLVLIFGFQIFYGYVYQAIGLLISIFMSGIAVGSVIITRKLERIKNALRLFMRLEMLISIFIVITALAVTHSMKSLSCQFLVFMMLFFSAGLLLGFEFPLAGKLYMDKKEHKQIGMSSGVLYGADLVGGWVAGIAGGVVLLPVLGLFNTCIVLIVLKLSSLTLLLVAGRLMPH